LFYSYLRIVAALIFSTLLAFVGAWYIGVYVNFIYPIWYKILGIAQTIQTYAPKNIYKQQFSTTGTEQHFTLFGQIVEGISLQSEQVKGYLMTLTYGNEEQTVIDTLLHSKEVQHLYDVSILLHFVLTISIVLAITALIFFLFTRNKLRNSMVLRKRDVYLALVLLLGLLVGFLVTFGFETVFYQLHRWVFPEEHQWFFYYEESLMTTMMKAPELFSYIGAFIFLLTLVLQWGLLSALVLTDRKLSPN